MATQPQFIGSPFIGQAFVSTANTSIAQVTGGGLPTSGALLVTGATNGTRILEISSQANATIATAGLLNIWIFDATANTYSIFDQITMATATYNGITKATRNLASYANLVLPSGFRLAVTTTISVAMTVTALGGTL